MDEKQEKAFEFATDACKQILTLSTGVIALTVTFSKDFVGQSASGVKGVLVVSWLFYLLSIFGGCWFLLAAAGSMARTEHPSIYDTNTRVSAFVQVLFFLIGLILTIVFGILAFE